MIAEHDHDDPGDDRQEEAGCRSAARREHARDERDDRPRVIWKFSAATACARTVGDCCPWPAARSAGRRSRAAAADEHAGRAAEVRDKRPGLVVVVGVAAAGAGRTRRRRIAASAGHPAGSHRAAGSHRRRVATGRRVAARRRLVTGGRRIATGRADSRRIRRAPDSGAVGGVGPEWAARVRSAPAGSRGSPAPGGRGGSVMPPR